MHADKNPTLEDDQPESQSDLACRGPIGAEKFTSIDDHRHRDRQPRAQQPRNISCRAMAPPEYDLRMHDEPIQRNRQLQKQNGGCEPAQESHARIIVEPA